MTIADISRRAGPYPISAGASYPFSFVVFGTDQITVTVADDDGKETVLASSKYTVTLNDNGGTVVLADSVEGATLVITSNVPITQETIITNKGGFYPDVLNDSYDKLTAICQQLEEKIERSIKVAVTGTITADTYKAELEAIADGAKTSASQAVTTANDANTLATSANSLATTANTNASQAVTTANNASIKADSAISTAGTASSTASNALTTANSASTKADSAVSTANSASTTAGTASTNASTALSTVTELQENLPSQVETEVYKQIGEELEETVKTIVREVAPSIVEETVGEDYAKKTYVNDTVSTEATARSSADTTLQGNIDAVSTVANTALANTLPPQTGNSNKFLTTDGTSASWAGVPSDDTKLSLSGGTMAGTVTFASGQTIDGYLPLSGGTMAGDITGAGATFTSLSVGGYTAEAVAESGTNYIRYSSGVQVCWNILTPSESHIAWSYPKAFSSVPSVVATCSSDSGVPNFATIGQPNTTATDIYIRNTNSEFVNGITTYFIAYGRWK